jgi:hypothetical protein
MSNQDQKSSGDVKIHVGSIQAGGSVGVGGRDVSITNSGSSTLSDNDVVTIGGVEATRQEVAELNASLDNVDRTIETARPQMDDSSYAAARYNATTFREQITAQSRPNEHILVQAGRALFELGPDIAGALVAAFTTPIVGKIVQVAGRRALDFYHELLGIRPNAPANAPAANADSQNAAPSDPPDGVIPPGV